MSGHLFIVGTPIGNLGDITLRAVETLRAATRIYAEDTRRTRSLLSHLGIEGKKLLSLHAHSSDRSIGAAVEMLSQGEQVVLVTDAGMPAVSDPGADLVAAARKHDLPLTVIPGPSAVTAAVALSGLVDGPFTFLGFLPRKGTKRKDSLRAIAESPHPTLIFESPHRMRDTLGDLHEACGSERRVCVCREITKKFEETLLAPLEELAAPDFRSEWLGELTLVIERGQPVIREELDIDAHARSLLIKGASVKDVTQALSRELSVRGQKVSRRELYQRVLGLTQES